MPRQRTQLFSESYWPRTSTILFSQGILFFIKIVFIVFIIFICIGEFIKRFPFQEVSKKTSRNPIIYWLNSSQNKPKDFHFVNAGTLRCPINATISVACEVLTFWEDHSKKVDAFVFYGPFRQQFPKYRNPDVLWGLIYEESPRINTVFYYEQVLNLFNYSSTFSRFSDVPFPLQGLSLALNVFPSEKYTLEIITNTIFYKKTSIKNYYLHEFAPVMYLQSNPFTLVHRNEYVLKLMEYIDIDCVGQCLNNKQLPQELTDRYGFEYLGMTYDPRFLNFTAKYKFHIAIESGVCNDYVTEKLWRPIIQGVVPIYFGSPTVRDWLPNNKSAILIEDFASPELLARHLHELLLNDTKYEEYLEHKTKGLVSNKKLISELNTRPYELSLPSCVNEFNCLLCKKLHDIDSSTTNIVTRKALDCKMPSKLVTGEPDIKFIEDFKITEDFLAPVFKKLSNTSS